MHGQCSNHCVGQALLAYITKENHGYPLRELLCVVMFSFVQLKLLTDLVLLANAFNGHTSVFSLCIYILTIAVAMCVGTVEVFSFNFVLAFFCKFILFSIPVF